jgi:hypothetical protein
MGKQHLAPLMEERTRCVLGIWYSEEKNFMSHIFMVLKQKGRSPHTHHIPILGLYI